MSGLMMARSRPLPASPPLQDRLDADYRRFDGFDSTPYPGLEVREVNPYATTPRPGQSGTDPTNPDGRVGPNARGIPGVVGSVGAAPLPVADCLRKVSFETVAATQSNPNFRGGPGGAYQGVAQTLAMTEISQNPPQPGDLASIIAGGG